MSQIVDCPHGGFLFELAGGAVALYVLAPVPDQDAFSHDGLLSSAFVSLRRRLVGSHSYVSFSPACRPSHLQAL